MGGGARWKNRDAAAIALAHPMSSIVTQIQSSFQKSQTSGLLSGSAVLIEADPDQTKLLNHACFGRPIITAAAGHSSSLKGTKDKLVGDQENAGLQWFQLGLEEAFYLSYSLNCLQICRSTPEQSYCSWIIMAWIWQPHILDKKVYNIISIQGRQSLSHNEAWINIKEIQETFARNYKAYSHLRGKNWVVRSGLQFGADFVAYRHHPSLVHSEYAVIVSSETDDKRARLTTWSDWQSMLRLCGSVAKTLLLLSIVPKSNEIEEASPACLDRYHVEEFEIKRWIPEKHREDVQLGKDKI